MTRDIRETLRSAAPQISTRPDVGAIERRVQARRAGRLTVLSGVATVVMVAVIAAVLQVSPQQDRTPFIEDFSPRPTGTSPEVTRSPSATPPAGQAEPAGISRMSLVTPSDGWALHGTGIHVTRDGGATWSQVLPSTQEASLVHDVTTLPGRLWPMWVTVAVYEADDPAGHLRILRSDDGADWQASTFAPALPDIGSFLLSFADQQNGWLSLARGAGGAGNRGGQLFSTEDGGITWQQLPDPPIGGQPTRISETVGFLHDTDGIGERLFRTQDAGQTWHEQTDQFPLPDTGLTYARAFRIAGSWTATDAVLAVTFDPAGPDEGAAVAVGRSFVTDNAGATWRHEGADVETADVGDTFLSAMLTGPDTWLLAAPDGTLAFRGLGVEPTQVVTNGLPTNVRVISFPTPARGWALAGEACDDESTECLHLYETADGGRTWRPLAAWPPDKTAPPSPPSGTPYQTP